MKAAVHRFQDPSTLFMLQPSPSENVAAPVALLQNPSVCSVAPLDHSRCQRAFNNARHVSHAVVEQATAPRISKQEPR